MAENIFLFVPNLIGYARIVLSIVSFYYMPFDHGKACFCYLLSGFLDAFDGHAARMLNQGTKFGAMLDQLTDRASLMGLLVVLSCFYPSYMLIFQLSMALDICSHWMHLHSSILNGSDSHKKIDLSANFFLYHYYTNRKILFVMCAGNELFYSMLYLLHFTSGPTIIFIGLWKLICIITAPIAIMKSVISLIHLWSASVNMGGIDSAERTVTFYKSQ